MPNKTKKLDRNEWDFSPLAVADGKVTQPIDLCIQKAAFLWELGRETGRTRRKPWLSLPKKKKDEMLEESTSPIREIPASEAAVLSVIFGNTPSLPPSLGARDRNGYWNPADPEDSPHLLLIKWHNHGRDTIATALADWARATEVDPSG